MRFYTSVSLYLLLVTAVLVEHVATIQWLALAKSSIVWNKRSKCVQARKQGLIERGIQCKICKHELEIMPHVAIASQVAMTTCQQTFAHRRWNCSSIRKAPNYTPDLTSGTREQSFVYALSSAAVGYTVARACSAGNILSCGCGRVPSGQAQGDFKWGGCGDNLLHGIKFSRSFCNSPWMRKKTKKTVEGVLNRHNNRAGRMSLRANLVTQCKCHGVSGSCNIKTCWKGLPRFQVIGEHLRQKYNVATEVMSHGIKKQPKLLQVNVQQGLYQNEDLVYTTKSPDYCLPNPKVGSIGTVGRRCNATSDDTDSCDSMCCGRGYRTYTMKKEEQCHCKFYLCCYVKCEQCWTQVDIHECK